MPNLTARTEARNKEEACQLLMILNMTYAAQLIQLVSDLQSE